MNQYALGLTLSTLGEIILGTTILLVHTRLKREHKVDKQVIREITHEQALGLFAICLIIVGYLIQVCV